MLEPYIVERNGKQYMYRSTSHYSERKGGPESEVEYMGVVKDGKLVPKRGYYYDEATGEFGPINDAMMKDAPADRHRIHIRRFGDSYLLMRLQDDMNLLEDLEASFGCNAGRTIMTMAMAAILGPSSIDRVGPTIERGCMRELVGLDQDADLSCDILVETIRSIGGNSAGMYEFFKRRIAGERVFVFDFASDIICDSIGCHNELGNGNGEMVSERLNIGLVTDTSGRPLLFQTHSGSVTDVSAFNGIIEAVGRLGGGNPTLVIDRVFISPGSIMGLLENRIDFVMPIMPGDNPLMKSVVTGLTGVYGDEEHTLEYCGRIYEFIVRRMGIRRNIGGDRSGGVTTWEDPDGHDLVSDTDEKFYSCDEYIDVFAFRDVDVSKQEIADMDATLRMIVQCLDGTVPNDADRHFLKVAGQYSNMLMRDLDENGEMHVRVRQNARTFSANRKGVFMALSPARSNRTIKDILWMRECERRVRDSSSEDGSKYRHIVPDDRTSIDGELFVRMVSMILRMEIYRRISKSGRVPSKSDISSIMDSTGDVVIVHGGGWRRMTDISKENRLIYKMLGVDPPKDPYKH